MEIAIQPQHAVMGDRDEREHGGDSPRLSRRSYLLLGGATAATLLSGCSGSRSTDAVTEMQPLQSFGYGGDPIVEQETMSMSVSTMTETEPNDDRSLATPIDVGVEIEGSLSTAEVDWFAFEVVEGDTFTVEATRMSDDGVSLVAMFDPEGNNLDQVYIGNSTPVSVTETAEQSGTYFAEVVDVNQGDGAYTLGVWKGEPTTSPTPEITATPTPAPTATPTPTPTPTATPTPTPTPTPDDGQVPLNDVQELPGTLQVEDFDQGGQNVAYHDDDSANNGGLYRPSESVDIENRVPEDGNFNVGWTQDGEWLEYTVDVVAGTYDLECPVAKNGYSDVTSQVRIRVGDTTIGTIDVQDTGGWGEWVTKTLTDVTIPGGSNQVLRLEIVGGHFNLDEIRFTLISQETTQTATPTPIVTPTPTNSVDYGVQGYGEYGFGGISN